jgi:NAD(P)-dependent dehydrogenase (short-subunit alcohol dehydrogenase family)
VPIVQCQTRRVALLDDKVVLLTGGASGMGRAGAVLMAREHAAHIYLVDLNEEGGAGTVDLVREAGGNATFVRDDVCDDAAIAALIRRIVDEHGRLDCAWNNAGITDVGRPFAEVDRASWDRMIAINLTSVFVCMKYELQQMELQGFGSVVNTASASGLVATPGLVHYTAAKHGVLGLTKQGALEYNNKGVRVNAVCPGMVDTPLTQGLFDSNPRLAASIQRLMPGGKLGQPSEVAEAVAWLFSDHASWVSGLSMVIDGGYVNR